MVIHGWHLSLSDAVGVASGLVVLVLLLLAERARRRRKRPDAGATETAPTAEPTADVDEADKPGVTKKKEISPELQRVLVSIAVAVAWMVAGIAGYRSWGTLATHLGGWTTPAIVDGLVAACTLLRLAALGRGWRLPGVLLVTYGALGGTVYLNTSAVHGRAEKIAHGLAPAAYAILFELLALLLKLHLGLKENREARVTLATVVASPVVSWLAYLHNLRTGAKPKDAREMAQRLIRARSRLVAICPSPAKSPWPWDLARTARRAALGAIRDGLIEPRHLSRMLDGREELTPRELLKRVDQAVLEDAPDAVSLAEQVGTLTAAAVTTAEEHGREVARLHDERTVEIADLTERLRAAEVRANEAKAEHRTAAVQMASMNASAATLRADLDAARGAVRTRGDEIARLRSAHAQEIQRLTREVEAAQAVPKLHRQAAGVPEQTRPRRVVANLDQVADGGPTKKDEFEAELRRRAAEGDRAICEPNTRRRNELVVYPAADRVGLSVGTARRYLTDDLLAELQQTAVKVSEGVKTVGAQT